MGNSKQNSVVTVCLTGDIDYFEIESVEGCLEPLFQILQRYQSKMTIPITAKAVADYPQRAEFVIKQGHEVAIHGDVHEAFSGSVEEQVYRLEKAKQIFKDTLGIVPIGFRAPRLQHNENTYLALRITDFLYDSSRGREEIMPQLPIINKCSYDLNYFPLIKPALKLAASARFHQIPARPFFLHNHLVELPITGPSDWHFIVFEKGPRYLPAQSHRIAEIWLDILRYLKQKGNQLFVMQVHPYIMSPSYTAAIELFLKGLINENGVQIKLMSDVARSLQPITK